MSLFGSLLPGFDDDPFFGRHRNIMRQMNQMMNTMIRDPFTDDTDPFFSPPHAALPPPQPAITAGGGGGGGRNHHHHQQITPFVGLGIPNIANMMTSMNQMGQSGNCHMFSSSSVMTMTTGPDGKPQVYQATSSSRAVPGGVRETRRSISDSRTGTRKLAIGHHIGERSHIIEREHTDDNTTMEERQEFINLDEDEAPQFDREFRQRTQGMGGGGRGGSLEYRRHRQPHPPQQQQQQGYRSSRHTPAAIQYTTPPPSASRFRSRSRPLLSITQGGSRDDRARRRDREERGHRSHRRYQPTM